MLPVEIEKIKEETERVERELFPPEAPPTGATGPTGKKVEPAKVTPTGATGPTGPESEEGKAEHKYSVLQGKYNKEVPRLHKDLKSANEQLLAVQSENARLRSTMADMNTRITAIEKSGKEPEEQAGMLKDLESDPDVQVAMQNFPDVWKAVNKALAKQVEAIKASTAGKLEKVEADVKRADETAKTTADQTFIGYLDVNVPGWREVNTDDEFKAWLAQPLDKYSGRTKMDIIKESIERKNAQKVSEFFVDFAKEKEAEEKKAAEVAVPVAEPDGEVVAEPVKVPVAPPKGKQSVPPKRVESDTTKISSDYIADFYDKVRREFYKGKQDQMLAEEKRIEKAVAEGRVV